MFYKAVLLCFVVYFGLCALGASGSFNFAAYSIISMLFAAVLGRTMRDEEVDRLRTAIQKTLDENGHLADGEDCTLIELKKVMRE